MAALAAMLLLSACGSDEVTAGGAEAASPADVPAGLETGCPPPETRLRFAGGDLAVGAVAVRLCPGAPSIDPAGNPSGLLLQAPVDELTTGVDELVQVVNDLPAAEQRDCPSDDGPHHVYWFRYPDGDARAVAYDEAGCHTAVVGDEVRRQDGEVLAAAFADALFAQRAAATPPADEGEPPACPMPPLSEPTSVLPAVPLSLTAARWCVGVAPYGMRSAPIPDDLLERLNAGLLGPRAEGRDTCDMPSYSATVEGVTAWGDRVSLLVPGYRVVARTGFGRDAMSTEHEGDPQLIAALHALPLGPVERWTSKD